jgi:hypothetical protein
LREEIAGACATFIGFELLPRFQRICESILGLDGWPVVMVERDPDRPSILFRYPKSFSEYQMGAYLRPNVWSECKRPALKRADAYVE